MIAVDTSAIVAIAMAEAGHEVYLTALLAEPDKIISAVSVLEFTIVLSRSSADAAAAANAFLFQHDIRAQDVSAGQLAAAQEAFMTYGKGRHPAQLNFGDCFSYALAKTRRAPLLFKGGDFALTDIRPAATRVR